ncbi:hypothetical protein MTsPCn5_24740 [Croceitalea sp. MTPC5]|uniref:hypothetical protein n=1 Tax=Croceitalea sp. MTPC5 TaxID=3056565 RepID=UPI002B380CB5|nr:hypothetical protein MTsPCn5_24740 [Croceitalea sp. MTPC5]
MKTKTNNCLYFFGMLICLFLNTILGYGQNQTPITEILSRNQFQISQTNFNVTTSNGSKGILWTNRDNSTQIVLFDDGKQGFTVGGDINNDGIRNFLNTVNNAINHIPETIALWKLAVETLVPNEGFFDARNTDSIIPRVIITEDDVQIINRQSRVARPARLAFAKAQNYVFGTNGIQSLSLSGETRGILRSDIMVDFNIPPDVARAALLNWEPKRTIEIPKIQTLDEDALDLSPIEDFIKNALTDALLKQIGAEGLGSAISTAEEILGEEAEDISPREFIDRLTLAYGNAGRSVGISRELVNFCAVNAAIANNFLNGLGFQLGRIGIVGPDENRILPSVTGLFTSISERVDKANLITKKQNKSLKSCGNPKGFPRDAVNSEINNFKFCGVLVTQRGENEWEFLGNVFKDNGLFKEELDDRAELAGKRHSNFLKIDNDAIEKEVNSLNERLFNGEGNLPIGLVVSSDITTKFSSLSTEYIRNFAEVTNRDLERLSKDINNRDIPGGPNAINDTEKEDNDDVQDFLDFLDGLDDDDDDSNGRNNRNSIQNTGATQDIAITPQDLANPNFFKKLLAPHQPSENKILEKVFLQALMVPNTNQGLAIGEGIYDAEQAELFQYTYLAATGAKSYLEAYMNHDVKALNTSDVWMDMLQQKDQGMYSTILEKLSEFYQSDRGLKDESVFIAPQFTFGLEITPTIAISNTNDVTNLRVNNISYDIDVVLTAARLVLATDTDKDLKADLGIVLNKEELRFLLDTWAKDTNGDGLIDEGYLIWLQHKLQKTKQKLSKVIDDGQHEVFGSFNQILFPLAIAEFYKQQLTIDPSLRALSPELATLVDQDNLKAKDLLAKKAISYDQHTSFQSKYVFESESKKGPSIPFIPSKAQVQWNPIAFEHTTTLPKKGTDVNHTHSRPTTAALAPTLSFSNPDVQLKPETLILGITSEGILTLNNTTNSVIPANTYILTTSTSEDIMYFNVLKFDAPEIPVGGTYEVFFDYTPIAADSESGNREEFRLHAASAFYDILFQRDFLIAENSIEAIDLSFFCEQSLFFSDVISSGEDVSIAANNVGTNNLVASNSKLTIKAIEGIDLEIGFDAKPGAIVELAITDCNEVQNIMASALQNNM